MIADTELETWRRDWQSHTEPLPKLKKKIQRQNWIDIARVIVMCACLALSTTEAVRTRGSFVTGLAAGLWFAGLVMGAYIWRVRRGTWKPAAQTTQAYLELSYKRAVAKARQIRFSIYFLLTILALLVAFAAWNWKSLPAKFTLIFALYALVLFGLLYFGRRNAQEIKETRKLLEQTNESSDVSLGER